MIQKYSKYVFIMEQLEPLMAQSIQKCEEYGWSLWKYLPLKVYFSRYLYFSLYSLRQFQSRHLAQLAVMETHDRHHR